MAKQWDGCWDSQKEMRSVVRSVERLGYKKDKWLVVPLVGSRDRSSVLLLAASKGLRSDVLMALQMALYSAV